jgi:hypothetical protein
MNQTDGRAATVLEEIPIGEIARICRVHRDRINDAMNERRLRYRRREGRRVSTIADVLEFKRLISAAR